MIKKIVFFLFIIYFAFFSKPNSIFAEDCDPNRCASDDSGCLKDVESSCLKKLSELGNAKNTLANQITLINSQINLTLLKINQTENSIKSLEKEIANLTVEIGKLDVNLNQLSSIYVLQIVQNYKLEKKIPPFAYLISSKLNNFLAQYKYVSNAQKASQNSLIKLETVRSNYDAQKTAKAKKQSEMETLQKTLASQRVNLNSQKIAKNSLLDATKNDEKKYQQLLTEAQNQLRQLRSFSSSAGGDSCLPSSPGSGSDGNFYSQRDPAWCRQRMGNSQDTIGEVGCYISSISMVFKKLGSGTTPSIYAADPSKFSLNTAYAKTPSPPSGYQYQQVSYNSSTIDKELNSGRYVIVQIRTLGTVSGMHFVVIISGSNGTYKIHDPWYGPDKNFTDHYSIGSIMSLRLFTK